jgi:hypothetical protein
MRSFADNAVFFDHKPTFIISSDLETKNHCDFATSIAEDIEKTSGIRTVGIGKKTSSDFIQSLASEFDPEVLSYALVHDNCTNHFGHNSNQLILATAGRNYIQSDDDVYCQPGHYENTLSDKLEYSNAYLPADLQIFNSRDEMLGKVKDFSVDVLAEHYNLLGKAVDDDKVISLTTTGAYGDSGMGNLRFLMRLKGEDRKIKLASDELYNRNKFARNIIRIPNKTTIGSGTHLMGMNIGVHNKEFIPPFFPLGRSVDLLFSVMTRLVYLNSNTAFLGFGLYHSPEDTRVYAEDSMQRLKPNLVDLIMAVILACRPDREITSPHNRLNDIADVLLEFSSFSKMEFVEIVHDLWSKRIQDYALELENLLEEYNRKPVSWATDTDLLLEDIYELLREPSYLFSKKRYGFNSDDVQYHMGMYGKLLKIWPDIHKHSAQLNQEGRGLLK